MEANHPELQEKLQELEHELEVSTITFENEYLFDTLSCALMYLLSTAVGRLKLQRSLNIH